VLLVFSFDEFADSHFPDRLQVVFWTHPVVIPIPIVHTIDVLARILVALKTKGGIASFRVIDSRTFCEQVCASRVSRPAANTLAPLETIDLRKISTAHGTIHSTRCDQIF
jgi:hypothetical protein